MNVSIGRVTRLSNCLGKGIIKGNQVIFDKTYIDEAYNILEELKDENEKRKEYYKKYYERKKCKT